MGYTIAKLRAIYEIKNCGIVTGTTHICDPLDFPIDLIGMLYSGDEIIVSPDVTIILVALTEGQKSSYGRAVAELLFDKNCTPMILESVYFGPDLLLYVRPKPRHRATERIREKWLKRFVEKHQLNPDRVDMVWTDEGDE